MAKRILIIDDEQTLGYFLRESLQEEGYEVLLALTGEEGLAFLRRKRIDLVLLDMRLPDMDGLEILRRVDNLPVIVLSSHGSLDSAVAATKLGALDYLAKPINLEALKRSVEKALSEGPGVTRKAELPRARKAATAALESDWLERAALERGKRDLEERLSDLEKSEHLSACLIGTTEVGEIVEAGLEAVISLGLATRAAIFVKAGEAYLLAGQRLFSKDAFVKEETQSLPAKEVEGHQGELSIPALQEHLNEGESFGTTLLVSKSGEVRGVLLLVRHGGYLPSREQTLLESIGKRLGCALEAAFYMEGLRDEKRGKALTEEAMEGTHYGFLVANASGCVTLANEAARRILGQPLEGRELREIFGVGFSPEGFELGIMASRWELEIARENGTIPLDVSMSPLRGERKGVVVLFCDLSEARALEEERRRRDRLSLLEEMSAVVAHEIRNPLAGIGAGIQHLAKKVKGADAESLQMILKESERVNRIIEDVLIVSRPLKLSLGPCDPSEVLREVTSELGEKAKARKVGIEVHYGSAPLIQADAIRLHRAFTDLLAGRMEALSGGEVQLTVAGSSDYVEVSLRDKGVIEDTSRIFEPFGPGGLKMAVARRIIEEHGGRMEVRSGGRGTTFTIRLPIGGK